MCKRKEGAVLRPDELIVSPCSNPEMGLEEVLAAYSGIGYRRFEVFTGWAGSAFDYHGDPAFYLTKGREHGMSFASMHLPPIGDDIEAGLAEAVTAARFAAAIGVEVCLYKAATREGYVAAAVDFLDAIEDLPITAVLQNHAGTAISTLDDFRAVIDGIADGRMKALLEVGQFHSVGVSWQEGYDLLGESIALVHIKDQVGRRSVPFGTGDIDLPGLFAHMHDAGYEGGFVIEMEVQDRENTLRYLADARDHISQHSPED
jgi:sugar phosphate isomerase/epimerase